MSILGNGAFIIALALQLAAALLLVGNTETSREKIIKTYRDQHTAIAFFEDGSLVDRHPLEAVVNTTWINRIAFGYLCAGYLISIFGACTMSRRCVLILVLLLVFVLSGAAMKIAKKKSTCFEPIKKEDLPLGNGVMFVIVEKSEESTLGEERR